MGELTLALGPGARTLTLTLTLTLNPNPHPNPRKGHERAALVAFTHPAVHSSDLATFLDQVRLLGLGLG